MTKQTSEKKTRGTGGRSVIDTETRTHIGQVIRKYRTAADMDQAELASKLGYSKTAIGNWELDLTRLDIANVPKLCKGLNIPVTDLLLMSLTSWKRLCRGYHRARPERIDYLPQGKEKDRAPCAD